MHGVRRAAPRLHSQIPGPTDRPRDAASAQVDAPDILRTVGAAADWNELRAAVARQPHSKPPLPALKQDVMAHDLLFLQPHETVDVPFAFQYFKSGPGTLPAVDASAASRAPASSAGYDELKQICVRVASQASGQLVRPALAADAARPLSPCHRRHLGLPRGRHDADRRRTAAELRRNSSRGPLQALVHSVTFCLRRVVLDRTLRLRAPRDGVLQHAVALNTLPGSASTLRAREVDLRRLTAVCSLADVRLTAQCSQPSRGVRDTIAIKARPRSREAQFMTFYISLFADDAQAAPVEVWQVRRPSLTASLLDSDAVHRNRSHSGRRSRGRRPRRDRRGRRCMRIG